MMGVRVRQTSINPWDSVLSSHAWRRERSLVITNSSPSCRAIDRRSVNLSAHPLKGSKVEASMGQAKKTFAHSKRTRLQMRANLSSKMSKRFKWANPLSSRNATCCRCNAQRFSRIASTSYLST